MNNLIIFLKDEKYNGCSCNPDLSPQAAAHFIYKLPADYLTCCVKTNGVGAVSVNIDSSFIMDTTKESLAKLLTSLSQLETFKQE